MLEKINNSKSMPLIAIMLIALIPVGLLISSGVSEFLTILLVLFYSFYFIIHKDYSIIKSIYFKLLAILWVYLIINFIWSQNYYADEYSFRSFGFIKYILLVFAFKFYLQKNKNLKFVLLFWYIIVTIVSLDVFYEYFNHENILGFKSEFPGRIASFLRTELKIGHFLLGFSFLATSFLLSRNLNHKSIFYLLFCYLFLLTTILALCLTGERSNAIRGFFCLILFIIFGDNKILKYKYLFLILSILLIIIVYNFSSIIQNRFNGQVISPIKENGLKKTLINSQYGSHYITAIKIFKSYPILGVGNKNFRNECKKEEYFDSDYPLSNLRCATHPHQIYLELLSEHGLIGTIIILYIIFFILYKNIKIYKGKKNLIHLSSILFVLQTFLPFIPSGSFFVSWTATIFWINFAVMIAVSKNKS
jgi:hypothetical protein